MLVLSIDQGTTNTKSLIIDSYGKIISIARKELKRVYPRQDWVEQVPEDIWKSVLISVKKCIREGKVSPNLIKSIGIADQGETIILWDKHTGIPVYNAIVWQDRRTEQMLLEIEKNYPDIREEVKKRTGLMFDSYFSAPKIKWILDNVDKAKEKIKKGNLIFGTTDTWLVWNMTKGKKHITDYTTASRTMLLNIHNLKWDKLILDTFGIPEEILPETVQNGEITCYIDENLFGFEAPIGNLIVDQQAALFGHMCFDKKEIKATYGTGVFVLMNIGDNPLFSRGLLTTIAWVLNNRVTYALDGGIFFAGALIDYLISNFKFIKTPAIADRIASSIKSSEGVYFIPSLLGLAAPYWDPTARGLIIGLNPTTTYKHIVRAALEGIALSAFDVVEEMSNMIGEWISLLKVDGGLTSSKFLMQFQSDILGVPCYLPSIKEITGFGTGLLAGIAIDLFSKNLQDLKQFYIIERIYQPSMSFKEREEIIKKWKIAVSRSRHWINLNEFSFKNP